MKPVVIALLAATVVGAAAAALPAPVHAAPIGGLGPVGPVDPVEPRGPWRARVRWVDVHTDGRGNVYTWRYADLVGATQQYCEQQLQSAINTPGVSVVQPCEPD